MVFHRGASVCLHCAATSRAVVVLRAFGEVPDDFHTAIAIPRTYGWVERVVFKIMFLF